MQCAFKFKGFMYFRQSSDLNSSCYACKSSAKKCVKLPLWESISNWTLVSVKDHRCAIFAVYQIGLYFSLVSYLKLFEEGEGMQFSLSGLLIFPPSKSTVFSVSPSTMSKKYPKCPACISIFMSRSETKGAHFSLPKLTRIWNDMDKSLLPLALWTWLISDLDCCEHTKETYV